MSACHFYPYPPYKPIKFGSGLETLLDIYVTCFRYEDQIWEQALPRSRGEVEVLTKCLFICLHGQHTLPRLRFRFTKTCTHGSQYYYLCLVFFLHARCARPTQVQGRGSNFNYMFLFSCLHGQHDLPRLRFKYTTTCTYESQYYYVCLVFFACTVCTPYVGLGQRLNF